MGDAHRKMVQLQSCVCELQAELSAKKTTTREQRARICDLLAENEMLRGRLSMQSTEVAQRDSEAQRLREKVQDLEERLHNESRASRALTTNLETFKSKTLFETEAKDAQIKKLQLEVDGLILVNDDFQEELKQKKSELDGLLTECNKKLHQAIRNERESVKTVLDHCRVIITKLNAKVNESNNRSLLLENEMRTKMDMIQRLGEQIAEQKRVYGGWVELLRLERNQGVVVGNACERPVETDEEAQHGGDRMTDHH